MIVKSLEDLVGTEDETSGETWSSRRFILKKRRRWLQHE